MAIEQIPSQPLSQVPCDPATLSERTPDGQRGPRVDGDRVELSAFGQMVAKSLADFQNARAPRPDRVKEFKAHRDAPVDWSDQILATVARRMRDA